MKLFSLLVERTLRGRIRNPDEALQSTIRLANQATNSALQTCHAKGLTSYYTAHALLYKSIRAEYPALQSSLVQGLIEVATQITKREPRRVCMKKPGSSIRLNARCFTPYLESKRISLVTIEGRKKYDLTLPPTPPWLMPGARVKSIRLRSRGERIEVDLCFTLPTPKVTLPLEPRVVGVDIGVRTPAVTSNADFLGTQTRHHQRRYAHLRQVLQRKGTRSSKRLLRRLSGRERRYMRNQNHIIAKAIVTGADVVVVEDLTHIRTRIGSKGSRFNRRFHRWCYRELATLIKEKCEVQGKWLLQVDPRNTSKTCSRCKVVHNGLGSAREHACPACGFRLNRDLGAARNIRDLGNARIARLTVNEPNGRGVDGLLVVVQHVTPELTSKPPASAGGS